jgi:hypothetical protein
VLSSGSTFNEGSNPFPLNISSGQIVVTNIDDNLTFIVNGLVDVTNELAL